jgi:hypothetical protein
MHYCVKCGAKVADDAKFCTKCGSPQKTDVKDRNVREKNDYNNEYTQVIPNIKATPNRIEEEENYNSFNSSSLKPAIAGVLIGLAILAAGLGAYYAYSKNDKSVKEQTAAIKSTENAENSKDNSSDGGNSTSKDNEGTDKSKDNSKNNSSAAANTNSKTDEYMFSNSGSVKLTDDQVSSLSKENLALARNEIFARHGFVFQTEPFKTYFNNKTWYKSNAGFKGSDEELSSVEKSNVDLILKYENSK